MLEQKRYKRARQVLQYAKIDYMHWTKSNLGYLEAR